MVFGAVSKTPSAPPSETSTGPSCQIARVPSLTAPGMSESAVVVTAQVEPLLGFEVVEQGTVNENER